MENKIICEYCKKIISKTNKLRHEKSKSCANSAIKTKSEYKCKYCEKTFNRLDKKNEHENNISCNAKELYHKIELKNKELEQKDNELTQQKKEIMFYKEQISDLKEQNKQMLNKIQPNNQTTNNQTTNNQTTNNQTYNNCNFVYVNINCPDDITTALPNLTIEHEMQGGYGIGLFLMDYVLKGKILIHDISRKLMSYMLNDEVIKDNGTKIILKVLKPIDKEINKRMFKNKYNEAQKNIILMHMGDVPLIINKYQGFDETDVFNGIQDAMFKNGEKKKIIN